MTTLRTAYTVAFEFLTRLIDKLKKTMSKQWLQVYSLFLFVCFFSCTSPQILSFRGSPPHTLETTNLDQSTAWLLHCPPAQVYLQSNNTQEYQLEVGT